MSARTALRAGDVATAVRCYRGPLLGCSEAPAIRDEREELFAALRGAALSHPDVEPLWTLFCRQPEDDLEVLDQLARRLPRHDPRRHDVTARMQRILLEEAPLA